MLHCVAVRYSVLQCVAMCCCALLSVCLGDKALVYVLHCSAVLCCVPQCAAVMQFAATFCSALRLICLVDNALGACLCDVVWQYVAVCYSALQCAVADCSVF